MVVKMTRNLIHDISHGNKNKIKRQDHQTATIKLRKLPLSVTVSDVKKHFKQFGKVVNVKLKKKKNDKSSGMGFVYFNDINAAETAIERSSGMDLLGEKIIVEWANSFTQPGKKKIINLNKKKNSPSEDEGNFRKKYENDIEEYSDNKKDCEDKKMNNNLNEHNSFKASRKQKTNEEQEPSMQKHRNDKRARIIVRNISFKATDELLLNHFKDFGAITDVKLLKKDDGKLIGCGFVQFDKKQSAIRAILERSGKPFLGRPIVCDWALPKDKYLSQMESEKANEQVKNEPIDDVKIKEEPCSEGSDDEKPNKIETKIYSEEEEEKDSSDSNEDQDDDDDDDDFEEDEKYIDKNEKLNDCYNDFGESDEEYEMSSHKRRKSASEEKKPKVISNDVSEGCTIFVKNIPFSATNEDLGNCMKQFGPVHYALICIDPLTEHSKGTGFVKFKTKEDADKCLQASGSLTVLDQNIEVMNALPRNDIKSIHERKKEKKHKDNRHLYLVKEGVIIAGTPAAKDVSVSDMEKRLKLEQWKSQMLRNLNMFVSNTRLVVYNIPLSWTDNQVFQLFKSHAGPGAYIKEARIMKDMRNLDANGFGKSKEFAFVHFTEHEHALRALRSINNNPNIFSKAKRPIVSFSIENKAIHKIKQRRLQKSRMANIEKQSNSNDTKVRQNSFEHKTAYEDEMQSKNYSGLEAKPGNKKMRTKFNLKTDAAVHEKNVRKEKQKQKMKVKINNRNKKNKAHSQPKPKRKEENDDHFSKLVNEYKTKLISANSRKRWFE